MTTDKETLKMLDDQRRAINDRCREEGCFGNYSAVDILHIGITHFLKQYQYQESLTPLLSAYLGIARDIIDDAINTNPDKATHVRITPSATTPEQKEIHPTESKAERVREYEKDIQFTHDYTPKFEVQDTLFEIITIDTDAEGPIYPPLKAFSKQREEEVRKALYSMLIEKFPMDKIDLSIIGLYNEFVSILTFFEDNRESFSRSITRGYFTTPHGRKHNLYIDAINATNLPTPDNIRAKYRYTVNDGKVYYQFRIERQDLVEEFTLGKDEDNEIAEIIEYRFDGCQRSITINMDSFTNAENIVSLSKFFIELAQSFDRRFNQR
jgi:hypothetical protein